MENIVRRVDKGNMGERLGKVPNQTLSFNIVLFCEQAHVVAQTNQTFE
jgi:hypothetical protein